MAKFQPFQECAGVEVVIRLVRLPQSPASGGCQPTWSIMCTAQVLSEVKRNRYQIMVAKHQLIESACMC